MFRSVVPAGECSSRAVSALASCYLTVPLLFNFLYTFDTVLLILVFIVSNKYMKKRGGSASLTPLEL